jgi:hypothetical protein
MGDSHCIGLQQEKPWEEEDRLTLASLAAPSAPALRLDGGKHYVLIDDVWISLRIIGIGVVAAMSLYPPAKGDPDEQIEVYETEHAIDRAGSANLPVPCIVTDYGTLTIKER